METKSKQSPVEQFVRAFVRTHRKGAQMSQRHIDLAIALIDKKLAGTQQLRVSAGQYNKLVLGVQFYLNTVPLNGNRKSIERAKAVLEAF